MEFCNRCGSDSASIRLDQRWGSQTRRYRLCEACAAELGVLASKPAVAPRYNDLFAQIFAQRRENACPDCGHTLMDLRKTGRVGCPSCYVTFQRELTSLVGQEVLHNGHLGLLPKRLQALRWTYLERERIRDRLSSAVADEDYESAAELRDEIRRRDEMHWSNDS